MSKRIDALKYFPPNQQSEPYFKFFAEVFNHGLDESFWPLIEAVEGMYDPASPNFDADYVIRTMGSENIANLIGDDTNQNAISILIPGLLDLKGSFDALKAILKLTNINYQNIVLLKQRDGCTQATILLSGTQTVSEETVKLLDKLAKELMPTCVRLSGVTNCEESVGSGGIEDEWDLDVGVNSLSQSFRLDRSFLGRSQGHRTPGTDITSLFCNTDVGHVELDPDLPHVESIRVVARISEFMAMPSQWLLDNTLILSRGNVQYQPGVKGVGGRLSTDLIDVTEAGLSVVGKETSYCYGVFVPGFSIMGRDANRLSHNATRRHTNETLDDGYPSRTMVLSRGEVSYEKVCQVVDGTGIYTGDLSNDINPTIELVSATHAQTDVITAEKQYESADYLTRDYVTEGFEGITTAVATPVAISSLTYSFFGDIQFNSGATTVGVANPAYNITVVDDGIRENKYDVGFYTQFDYNEREYKV